MRVARIESYGPLSGIELKEMERPVPGPGEVLVEVEAVGVNPVDWKIAEGYLRDALPTQLPYTLGCEVSGRVVGSGEEVFGYPSVVRGGGYADFAILLASEMAPYPRGVSLRESAALPVAASTAYEGLFLHGRLEAGDTILILGGAGGVGTAAIQMAKWKGAKVFATASARNHDYLRELGAEPIDYATGPLKIRDVDFVFDCVGGATGGDAVPVLKRGGQFVSPVFPLPPEDVLGPLEIRSASYGIAPSTERLNLIAAMVNEGVLRIPIAAEYGLHQVVEALEASKSGRTRGKLLVVPGIG